MLEKNLIFVESEAKKKTIKNILGRDYEVLATSGHICNLKNSDEYNIGIDFKTFVPKYEIITHKKNMVSYWKKFLSENNFDNIFLATDPDREGEKIASDLKDVLFVNEKKKCKRLLFYEITPDSIKKTLENPGSIDENLVQAQKTRQVLDKMIGFCISPILIKHIKAYSAGRVQSVVLRMIVEKEDEIIQYEKKEKKYLFIGIDKKKRIFKESDSEMNLKIYTEEEKNKIKSDSFFLEFVKKKEEEGNVFPNFPFTTSSLIFEAQRRLKFSIQQITKIAQKLYEGVPIKNKKVNTGLITYPRTDSMRMNPIFTAKCYDFIIKKWGKEYCNFSPYWKKIKTKFSQEAHESIHPTYLDNNPEKVKESLKKDEYLLYKLIYENSLTSLMSQAKIKKISYLFSQENNRFFLTSENICLFKGFLLVNPNFYMEINHLKDNSDSDLENEKKIEIEEWKMSEYILNKPTRYSEGTLVKELELLGIGRPSTYNSFGPILIKRNYVYLDKTKKIIPKQLGIEVNEWLKKFFPTIVDKKYTASLEEKLDEISKGDNSYFNFIKSFWEEFSKKINYLEKL